MYFDRYNGIEYKAMCVSSGDVEKYRYIMENWTILDITESYHFSTIRAIVNG